MIYSVIYNFLSTYRISEIQDNSNDPNKPTKYIKSLSTARFILDVNKNAHSHSSSLRDVVFKSIRIRRYK